MFRLRSKYVGLFLGLALSLLVFGYPCFAKSSGVLRGKVLDPLGGTIPQAKVVLLQAGKEISSASTDQEGAFELSLSASGRYSVRVSAAGFRTQDTAPVFVSAGKDTEVDVSLQIGTLPQEIVVSATGTAMPESQVGASVSVIDHQQLSDLGQTDVLESLRGVPGLQVVQTGQRGGTTSVFVRGGDSDFNKVLMDGIPANDIGGAFEFANVSSNGVDEVEILRGPNSVLYGTDAVSSVINMTTPHGSSTVPELTYSVDGGNFRTLSNDASIAGAFRQFDYFSEFSRFDTRNGLPNGSFHNATYAGNFGWAVAPSTSIRVTVRHDAVGLGDPGAIAFNGIPDDSSQGQRDTYIGVTIQNQTTSRWHNLARFASSQLQYHFINPTPTGTPFDPFAGTEFDSGNNYLGNMVTICGANGFCTTGQAILDFGGTYPQPFNSNTTRRSFYGQSDYELRSDLSVTGGFRYENENGLTNSQGLISSSDRNNYSTFAEFNGSVWRRLYATAGAGFDKNAVFGFAATPRVSLAYYLRRPSASKFFSDTKLKFNFGTGIKEPSILQQGSSLYALLSALPGGAGPGVSPIGPERSRSFDFGVEQAFWNNRARLGVTLFRDNYYDLIGFVDASILPELGVPPSVAQASGFGAYINSDSFRSRGAEIQLEANVGHGLRVLGEYTSLDAVVTRSFTGSALDPAFNPAFPTIPIGAFAPLVGARPFDRAPQSGSLRLDYAQRKFGVTLTGSFVGRRDGSTFLEDGFFGDSMLLPNRNLEAAYQLMDLSGRYLVNRHVTAFFSVSNLLNQHYQQETGFPALALAFRAGLKFTLGGEEGWWR